MEAVDKSENILLQASNSVLQVPRLKQGKFPISGWQLCAFLFLSPFLSTFFSLFNELAALHMLVDDSCQVCNQARKQNHIRDFNSAN